MRRSLYPYLNENVVGGGVEAGALVWFFLMLAAIIFQCYLFWKPVQFYLGIDTYSSAEATQQTRPTSQVVVVSPLEVVGGGVVIEGYGEPTISPTPEPTISPTVTPTSSVVNIQGYKKELVVGRFSNYWPPFGGLNCLTDCELFADGYRVDQAIIEGWKVVACPRELLLGTRIEYPPDSGVIWICRDYGDAITFYYSDSGLPIYWFDFLSSTAWVDYGSYIQVQMFIPCYEAC